VVAIDLRGDAEVIAEFDEEPSGLGFLPDGTPLVVLRQSKLVIRLESGANRVHADLSGVPCDTLNDMVVDEAGRAWVDAVRMRPASTEDVGETVVCLEVDGNVRQCIDGLVNPNGLAIRTSPAELVVAETYAHRLTAFELSDDGTAGQRRTYADLGDASPDGICCDSGGAVWVASVFTGEFLRVADGGDVIERVSVGERWAVACAFGGDDRATLFLLSAETTLETLRQPGGTTSVVETFEPGVRGAGFP
jgi:sugar lactone lactonase YvrE